MTDFSKMAKEQMQQQEANDKIDSTTDYVVLRMYDAEGNWAGPGERCLIIDGVRIDIDDYAAASNGRLVLPDAGE